MSLQPKTFQESIERANRYEQNRREKALKSPRSYKGSQKPLRNAPRAALTHKSGVSQRPAKRLKRQKGTIYADSVWSWAVRARDDHRCQRCGKRDEKNNHAHHVAPRSRRPDLKKVMSNGKTVCPPCHDWIHSHPIEAEAAGLLSSETYEAAHK